MFMNLGTQMAKIKMDKEKHEKSPLEFLKRKHLNIGLRHVLSWTKRNQDPKFHENGGFRKHGQIHPQTDRQTRFMFNKYRLHIHFIHIVKVYCVLRRMH